MNKKLRELLDKINNKKAEVRQLCDEKKIDEAKAAKDELKKLQDEFDVLSDLEDDALENAEKKAKEGKPKMDEAKKVVNAFVNAIKCGFNKQPMKEEDKEILNQMKEGTNEDGGLTVPKDIRTQIKELRRSEDALENLVNVEKVTTNSGTRVIEREADQTPFDNVEEAAEFPEVSTPQFDNIDYKIKKKGGILKITQELLSDTAENIINYLKKWIAKKAKATRNFMIIAKVKAICEDAEVAIASMDDLKDIYNEKLDPAIALGAVCVTNQSGFNYLDKLKDENGKYILQPDPTQPTKKLLFGMYPVVKLSNKTLSNINGKAPVICGDLKEAITIFDRETMTIDINNVAGDMWAKDQTGIKVRERLDIQTVDADAVVLGLIDVTDKNKDGEYSVDELAGLTDAEQKGLIDADGDGSYSEEELNKMSKEAILALATKLSYTMTKTAANTKADIITEFLAKQTAEED